ncbi:hypothetical protein BGX30_013088 [Mortierella sp. GBA39]|nr:hypothetical protein BGX30_013088 [Mortierella sp. GBA39]
MSARPCMFFLAGTCRNGTDCRFYHEGFSGIPHNVLAGDPGMSTSTTAQLNGTTTTTSAPAAVGGRSNSRTSPTSPLSASSNASAAQTPTSSSSSASSSNTRPTYAASRPCNWYMAGYCFRGDNCWFSHDRAVIEGRSQGNGGGAEDGITTSPGEANGELTSSTADATTASARNNNNSGEDDNEDHKCAICLEVPSTFGLLVSCNHAFCLTCIRTWRAKNIEQDIRSSEQDRTSVTKACPNCRTQSLFIVPSSYFPSTPEQKEAIIQNYKVVSARRPCKYFKESGERHWCPFGDDCFFAHLDARGQPCKVNLLSNPRLNRRRDRYGIGGSRSLFHRGRGFEGFGGYSDNYGNERYRSVARQRVHREMMEDLAFIQTSTSNVTHNHLEQIQGLLVRLARLGVNDLNFNPHDHTQVRAITEAFEEYVPDGLLEVDPESHYDEDDDDGDYEDEDNFEDEDVDVDEDEDIDSETTLERDEREAYEEFGDDLYFQTYFLSSNTAAASDPVSDYDIDAYHDSVWAEHEGYY